MLKMFSIEIEFFSYFMPWIYFLIYMNIFLGSWLLIFIYQSLCGVHALNFSAFTQSSPHIFILLLISSSLSLPFPIYSFCLFSIILPNLHIEWIYICLLYYIQSLKYIPITFEVGRFSFLYVSTFFPQKNLKG